MGRPPAVKHQGLTVGFIDRIKLQIVKKETGKMFNTLRVAVAGYKTYVIAGLGVLLPLIGFLYGPIDIPIGVATLTIPHIDFPTLWSAIQISGVATTIRASIGRLLVAKSESEVAAK